MRYSATARALAPLLVDRDPAKVALLAVDLPAGLAGPHGVDAVEAAVDEVLHPPTGVHRAVRLLAEEDGVDAHAAGEATVVLDEPLGGPPEPQLVRALRLTGDSGPVFARGETEDGHAVLAAWRTPHLAVEKMTRVGKPMIRVWKLPAKQDPDRLPRTDDAKGDDYRPGGRRPAGSPCHWPAFAPAATH